MDDIQESELRKINEINNIQKKIKEDKNITNKDYQKTEKEELDNEIMTTQIELLNKKENDSPINELNKEPNK